MVGDMLHIEVAPCPQAKDKMNAHRIETTIDQDGTLTLQGIPFQAGAAVEVIILECLFYLIR